MKNSAAVRMEFRFVYPNSLESNAAKLAAGLPKDVVEVSPAEQGAMLKMGGWFTAWGKDLDGFNKSLDNVNAFLGDWVIVKKVIHTEKMHTPAGDIVVASAIQVDFFLDESRAISPVVLGFNIDGVRGAFMILRRSDVRTVVNIPTAPNKVHCGRIGVEIPVPVNATWSTDASFKKYKPIHKMRPQFSTSAEVDVTVQCNQSYAIGYSVIDAKTGGMNWFFEPYPMEQSPMYYGEDITNLRAYVSQADNAFSAMVALLKHPISINEIVFDGKQKSTLSFATHVGSASLPTYSATFTPPEDLDLPEPPRGYTWALNIRGVLFLADTSGEPKWPYEVFDYNQLESEFAQVEIGTPLYEEMMNRMVKVAALMDYMARVGSSITMTSKVFGKNG